MMASRIDDLYGEDFYVWTQRQAAALRHFAETRPNVDLDFLHLIEEVEDLGTGQRDAVRSQVRRIIEHCLQLEYSRARYPRASGRDSIINARAGLDDKLSPSLRLDLEQQLARLESLLSAEGAAGQLRVILMHHPIADGAVSRRKALADRDELRALLRKTGAELVLHGHARGARLESIPGPRGPIPVLCVPSSSALPNPRDEAARWHMVSLPGPGEPRWARVQVRQWSLADGGFADAARYELRLPDMG